MSCQAVAGEDPNISLIHLKECSVSSLLRGQSTWVSLSVLDITHIGMHAMGCSENMTMTPALCFEGQLRAIVHTDISTCTSIWSGLTAAWACPLCKNNLLSLAPLKSRADNHNTTVRRRSP